MNQSLQQILYKAVYRLLKPLVYLLLKNGIPCSAFCEIAKHVYVDVAMEDFRIEKRKQTVSRVAILTGLSRKEITRIQELPSPISSDDNKQYNRAARVVRGWTTDPLFIRPNGEPKLLTFDEGDSSFSELVRLYSGDVPARAMFDELLRVGTIQKLKDGAIELLDRAYVPVYGESEKIEILGMVTSDLLGTLRHNIDNDKESSFLQRTVAYDRVPVSRLPEIRGLARMQSQTFLELVNAWLAQYDEGSGDSVDLTTVTRAGVGLYYFEGGSAGDDAFEENTEDETE